MTFLVLMSFIALIAIAVAVVPVSIILHQDARRAKPAGTTPLWTDDDSWRVGEPAHAA